MTVEPPMLMPMGIDARPLFKALTRICEEWRSEVDFSRHMDALYDARRGGVTQFAATPTTGQNVNILA